MKYKQFASRLDRNVKPSNLPFVIGGTIYDAYSGQPLPAGYAGMVTIGNSIFETGIDKERGERFWNCIKA